MVSHGAMWPLPTWEPPTSASASSFWPSARAEDSESCGNHANACDSLTGAVKMWPTPAAQDDNKTPEAHLRMKQRMGQRDGSHANRTSITSLQVLVQQWPTPRTTDTQEGRGAVASGQTFYRPSKALEAGEKVGQANLSDVAQMWPTVRANEEKGGDYQNQTDGTTQPTLTGAASHWQTPATDSFRSRGGERKDEMGLDQQARFWATPHANAMTGAGAQGREGGENLQTQTAEWTPSQASARPTPASRDWKGDYSDEGMLRKDGKMRDDLLPNVASRWSPSSPPAPPAASGPASSTPARTSRPRLNPAFVCWLMGWPWHWTRPEPINCAAPETASFRCRLRSRLWRFFPEP